MASSFLTFVSNLFAKEPDTPPLAAEDVLERADNDRDQESAFLDAFDEYIGKRPETKVDLQFNILFIDGFYWIPLEHPLGWALERTWGKRGPVHTIKTPLAGTCVVYKYDKAESALEDIFQMYVSHQRMRGEE